MSSYEAIATRRILHGTRQIIEFNWPQYLAGSLSVLLGAGLCMSRALPDWFRILSAIGTTVGAWWLVASVLASWWIYDHSKLTEWRWLSSLTGPISKWANVHAGFDETTEFLDLIYAGSSGTTIEIFDANEMTEPSIHRARRSHPSFGRFISGSSTSLPLAAGSHDVVFLLFAAHEVRSRPLRIELLRESLRSVKPGGKLVIVEHLRSLSNFIAFGFGFFHFYSRRSWMKDAATAGWIAEKQTNVTAFVTAFTWTKRR